MALKHSPLISDAALSGEVTAALALNPGVKADRAYITTMVALGREHKKGPWDWYKKIGEIRYAVARNARIAGYSHLQAYKIGPDGLPRDIVESGPPAEIIRSIMSPYGGQRHLMERFYTLRKVPGDMYLIRTRGEDGQPSGYMVLSADELDTTQLKKRSGMMRWFTTPNVPGENMRLVYDIPASDFIGRVWSPSHQFISMPESPLMAMETECEVLHELTETLKAKILSRFALAGLFYVPSEINDVRVAGIADSNPNGQLDKVLDYLTRAMSRNIRARDTAEALTPIMLRGPAEFSNALRHITLDSELWETDIRLRAELIARIINGLDQNQSAVQGVGDTNHWAAWAVSDEERRIAVQPDVEAFCWALTTMVLRHRLREEFGWSPERVAEVCVWYDLSAAAVRSNQQEDVRQAVDRFAAKPGALLRVAGLPDDDAPTDDEYIRMVGTKIGDPYLATYGMDEAKNIDWTKVGLARRRSGPDAGPQDDSPSGPGVGDPGSPDDIDSDTPRSQRPD